MHSNSSPTIYCPCDFEQVILPLWASVFLSTKQGESWPQGLCGWWMERRCQVSDMARSRYQVPGRHLMTSGRDDFFFCKGQSDGSLWLLGAFCLIFLDHIWTQEEGGLWSLCQGGGGGWAKCQVHIVPDKVFAGGCSCTGFRWLGRNLMAAASFSTGILYPIPGTGPGVGGHCLAGTLRAEEHFEEEGEEV